MIVFYRNDKNEDIFLKEAQLLRDSFLKEEQLLSLSPVACVFNSRQKRAKGEFPYENARVFSFAFLFNSAAKKSKKTFEDSFADHINHMRVK